MLHRFTPLNDMSKVLTTHPGRQSAVVDAKYDNIFLQVFGSAGSHVVNSSFFDDKHRSLISAAGGYLERSSSFASSHDHLPPVHVLKNQSFFFF